MNQLHAKYFRYVVAGGVLSTAPANEILNEEVGVKASPKLIEHILSSNPNPDTRIRIGTEFEARLTMGEATLDDAKAAAGGTHVANVYTLGQDIAELTKYDIRLDVVRSSDGAIIEVDLTDMQFTSGLDLKYVSGKRTYLPIELKSTATSDMTIDNS
jgi:hypothetical protein